jgi:hypothetical protein
MSAEDTELFEARDAGFDADTAEGVEEGCVVGAGAEVVTASGLDGSGDTFRSATAEDVGTTEEGIGLEEGGPQV